MSTFPSRVSRLAAQRWLGAVTLGAAGVAVLAAALSLPSEPSAAAPAPLQPRVTSGSLAPSALCLSSLPGSAPLQRWQPALHLARTQPAAPESWVALGQHWLALAQASGDAGYSLPAAACAEHALTLQPEHAAALGLLARVKLTGHEFAQARALAERILERDGEDPSALASLGDAALELGDLATASASTQRLMDVHPGLPAYARASYLCWLRGEEQPALELARLAIDAAGAPDERETRAWTLLQAAQLFWHRGDVAGAEAGYRMALAVHASYAPAHLGLARAAASREQWLEAAEHASRALSAYPNVEAAGLLGDVLARAGDVEAAAHSYEHAERLGRHDARSLSLFYSVRDREPARALSLARRERQHRADLYTEDALAWALYRTGELAAAAEHSQRALAAGTRDATLLFHRGAIQLALGQRQAGRALVAAALRQNPGFDLTGAAEARRLLGEGA